MSGRPITRLPKTILLIEPKKKMQKVKKRKKKKVKKRKNLDAAKNKPTSFRTAGMNNVNTV
jgi:hypothetical protein